MGFEAWRRVVNGVTKRSAADLLQLEGKVLSPVQVTKESDILMALVRWEGALREYQAAGGETLSEQRRKGGLLRMLPAVHRNKILWEVGDEKGPDEIIEWLRERLRATTSWSGEAPHTVAAVEDEEDVDIEDEMHALQEAGATTEEILAAVVRRFQRRPPQRDARQRGTTRPGAAQPRGPPRNRDDARFRGGVQNSGTLLRDSEELHTSSNTLLKFVDISNEPYRDSAHRLRRPHRALVDV